MIELRRLRRETSLDVTQALPVGKLRKGHAAELLDAAQGSHAAIVTVTSNDPTERSPRQEVHALRK